MKTIHINHAVWKEVDYFVAQCLNVDISSFGNTKEEAIFNLQEALECTLIPIATGIKNILKLTL